MIINAVLALIAVFISLIVHEMAHGYMALRLGDDTAKEQGRLSFNPLRHIDWFGTIILPLLLFFSKIGFVFGWAKPVPVNYDKLKNNRKNLVLVASAGILANIALALVSAVILKLILFLPKVQIVGFLAMFCQIFVKQCDNLSRNGQKSAQNGAILTLFFTINIIFMTTFWR